MRSWNSYISGPCLALLACGLLSQGAYMLFADVPRHQGLAGALGLVVVLTGLTALYIGLRVAIGGVRIDGGRVEIINALRTYRLRVEDVAVFGFATDGLLAGHAELVRRDGSRLRITSIQTAPTGGFRAPEAVQRLNAALEASRP